MTDSPLDGRRVVVVGGGTGLGRATALAASAAGAELVLAGRDVRKLEWTAGELGGPVTVHKLDLADEDSIVAFAAKAGKFDHLVSTAVEWVDGPLATLTPATIQRAFAAKATGPLLLAKHLAGNLHPLGSLTLFSGFSAWRPEAGHVLTATTDGTVAFLVQALAVELGPIRVNALAPGLVDSGAWNGLGIDKQRLLHATASRRPTGHLCTVDDVTRAALFLMACTCMTGNVMRLDSNDQLRIPA